MIQKLGWGGPRENQNGRPKLPPELKRVVLHARVKPETLHFLKKDKKGVGVGVDKLVVRAKKKTI